MQSHVPYDGLCWFPAPQRVITKIIDTFFCVYFNSTMGLHDRKVLYNVYSLLLCAIHKIVYDWWAFAINTIPK